MNDPRFTITVHLSPDQTVETIKTQLQEKGVKVLRTSSVYDHTVCYYVTCDPELISSLHEIGEFQPLACAKLIK